MKKPKASKSPTWRGTVSYPSNFLPQFDEDVAIGTSILWHGHSLPHEESPFCWCGPDIIDFDEDTETLIYVHRETH
jgi:hypothetical protein